MIDPYISGKSYLHKLDPRVKLLITLGFILVISLTQRGAYPSYILILSIIISLQILSEIKYTYFIKRFILLSPFMLSVIPLPFISGEPIKYIHFFSIAIPISIPGLEQMVSVIIKSTLSLQVALLLISTTSFNGLLAAMKYIHVPNILIQIYGMMWRYLYVITDEAFSIISARNARSGSIPHVRSGGSLFWRAIIAGNMMGSLIIRSLERSERIYYAMLSRGYNGEPRLLHTIQPLVRMDKIILISSLSILIFIWVIGMVFQ